jgi:hypothetical protein
MSAKKAIAQLASEGFGCWKPEQLGSISDELGLATVAEKSARKILPETATEELAAICTNAPLRAFDQAARNFVPTGKPYALSGYLKRYTWLWAKRYAEDVLKGKAVPRIKFPTDSTSIAELPLVGDQDVLTSPEVYSLPTVERLLDTMEIRFEQTGLRELSFRICCGGVEMQFFANVAPEAVVFFGYVPIFVPIYRRAALAEALSRINWKLLFGTFAMDLQDGQVRVRGFVPAPGNVLELEVGGKSLSTIRHEAAVFSKVIIELALTDHDTETLVERAAAGDE